MNGKKLRVINPACPNGKHKGIWNGYVVAFNDCGIRYEFSTEKGIRGRAQVSIEIYDGKITFEKD